IVRVRQENLPAAAVGDLVHAKRYSRSREMLLHRFETTAAKGDMINHAGIWGLRPVGRRDVVQVQNGMALTVEPRPWKIEGWPGPIHETQDPLIEANCVAELAGRDIVVVEDTDAHPHGYSPCLGQAIVRRSHGKVIRRPQPAH